MILYLNPKKVLKHFGQRPWLGRRIRGYNSKSSCGVKYKPKIIPSKDGFIIKKDDPVDVARGHYLGKWVPNEITVDLVISLRIVSNKPNFWEVNVSNEKYREQAELWLVDNCR